MGSKESDSDASPEPGDFEAALAPGTVVTMSWAPDGETTPKVESPESIFGDTQQSAVSDIKEGVRRMNSLDQAGHHMLSKLPSRSVLALVDAIKMFQLFTITWATVYSGTDICAESIDSTLNNFMVLWNVSDDSKGSLREQSYQSICCWCYHKKTRLIM